MTIKFPKAIVAYLEAQATQSTDFLQDCFAFDAIVRDEGQTIQGIDAIKAWQQTAHAKYQYTAEPLDMSHSGNTYKVQTRLSGNFPGSPIVVEYLFRLSNEKIVSLEIE